MNMETLNKFEICGQIPANVRKEIKIFFVFNDWTNGKNILFVTTDDSVYGFGTNKYGVCGLGHNQEVKEPQELTQLKNKNIDHFINGLNYVLAFTTDRRIYGWGYNYFGQLAVDHNGLDFSEPIELTYFESKPIQEVSCGFNHAIALTTDRQLCGWGGNYYGQVGCGKGFGRKIFGVEKVKAMDGTRVMSVHCSKNHSFAVTTEGLVYSWGENSLNQLGHDFGEDIYEPKLIENISNVKGVCSSSSNTYLLTKEGMIFVCGQINGQNLSKFEKLPSLPEDKIVSLHCVKLSHDNLKVCALSEDWIYTLDGNTITKTKYKTLLDFYSIEYQITYKSLQIRSENRVKKVMSRSFNNREFADLVFKLKGKESDDHWDCIYVHKWFVSENSEYFRRMFANEWTESQSNEISITGYSYEAYYQYLRWLYTDSIDTSDIEILIEMLSLSEEHLDKQFKDKCSERFETIVDNENVCDVYSIANKFRAKELSKFCSDLIIANIKLIIQTEGFDHLDRDTLRLLFVQLVRNQ